MSCQHIQFRFLQLSLWKFPDVQLDLEKAEDPEIKLPTSAGSQKKQENFRKTSASLTTLKPLTVWITRNYAKFLKRWEYQITLTCLLGNLCACQEAIVRTGRGTMDQFKIGKGVRQGCILSPCLFNFYAEYIMWNARLNETQTGIKIAQRNINHLRYADDTTLMSESKKKLKTADEGERGEWKGWLKTQFNKLKSWNPVPSLHGK